MADDLDDYVLIDSQGNIEELTSSGDTVPRPSVADKIGSPLSSYQMHIMRKQQSGIPSAVVPRTMQKSFPTVDVPVEVRRLLQMRKRAALEAKMNIGGGGTLHPPGEDILTVTPMPSDRLQKPRTVGRPSLMDCETVSPPCYVHGGQASGWPPPSNPTVCTCSGSSQPSNGIGFPNGGFSPTGAPFSQTSWKSPLPDSRNKKLGGQPSSSKMHSDVAPPGEDPPETFFAVGAKSKDKKKRTFTESDEFSTPDDELAAMVSQAQSLAKQTNAETWYNDYFQIDPSAGQQYPPGYDMSQMGYPPGQMPMGQDMSGMMGPGYPGMAYPSMSDQMGPPIGPWPQPGMGTGPQMGPFGGPPIGYNSGPGYSANGPPAMGPSGVVEKNQFGGPDVGNGISSRKANNKMRAVGGGGSWAPTKRLKPTLELLCDQLPEEIVACMKTDTVEEEVVTASFVKADLKPTVGSGDRPLQFGWFRQNEGKSSDAETKATAISGGAGAQRRTPAGDGVNGDDDVSHEDGRPKNNKWWDDECAAAAEERNAALKRHKQAKKDKLHKEEIDRTFNEWKEKRATFKELVARKIAEAAARPCTPPPPPLPREEKPSPVKAERADTDGGWKIVGDKIVEDDGSGGGSSNAWWNEECAAAVQERNDALKRHKQAKKDKAGKDECDRTFKEYMEKRVNAKELIARKIAESATREPQQQNRNVFAPANVVAASSVSGESPRKEPRNADNTIKNEAESMDDASGGGGGSSNAWWDDECATAVQKRNDALKYHKQAKKEKAGKEECDRTFKVYMELRTKAKEIIARKIAECPKAAQQHQLKKEPTTKSTSPQKQQQESYQEDNFEDDEWEMSFGGGNRSGAGWWDEECQRVIDARKDACRQHRKVRKNRDTPPDVLRQLWDDYTVQKEQCKRTIQRKIEFFNKHGCPEILSERASTSGHSKSPPKPQQHLQRSPLMKVTMQQSSQRNVMQQLPQSKDKQHQSHQMKITQQKEEPRQDDAENDKLLGDKSSPWWDAQCESVAWQRTEAHTMWVRAKEKRQHPAFVEKLWNVYLLKRDTAKSVLTRKMNEYTQSLVKAKVAASSSSSRNDSKKSTKSRWDPEPPSKPIATRAGIGFPPTAAATTSSRFQRPTTGCVGSMLPSLQESFTSVSKQFHAQREHSEEFSALGFREQVPSYEPPHRPPFPTPPSLQSLTDQTPPSVHSQQMSSSNPNYFGPPTGQAQYEPRPPWDMCGPGPMPQDRYERHPTNQFDSSYQPQYEPGPSPQAQYGPGGHPHPVPPPYQPQQPQGDYRGVAQQPGRPVEHISHQPQPYLEPPAYSRMSQQPVMTAERNSQQAQPYRATPVPFQPPPLTNRTRYNSGGAAASSYIDSTPSSAYQQRDIGGSGRRDESPPSAYPPPPPPRPFDPPPLKPPTPSWQQPPSPVALAPVPAPRLAANSLQKMLIDDTDDDVDHSRQPWWDDELAFAVEARREAKRLLNNADRRTTSVNNRKLLWIDYHNKKTIAQRLITRKSFLHQFRADVRTVFEPYMRDPEVKEIMRDQVKELEDILNATTEDGELFQQQSSLFLRIMSGEQVSEEEQNVSFDFLVPDITSNVQLLRSICQPLKKFVEFQKRDLDDSQTNRLLEYDAF